MSNEKLTAILQLLVPQIIQHIINNKNLTNFEAINLLYKSQLYAMLEIEESKLWHLSSHTLYELLEEEITTGKIYFPEEA